MDVATPLRTPPVPRHPEYEVVLVSGLGLMGGSLAAALAQAGWRVIVHHHRPEVARAAAARGWGEAITSFAEAAHATIAVVCTPVGVIPATVRALAAQTTALITDVGSVKGSLCRDLADLGSRFLGSHPMAGSHRQGLDAADPQLYRDRLTIVTPQAMHQAANIHRIEALWRAVGCRTVIMTPEAHDEAVARASHLPHVLASLIASALTEDAAPVAAGGFRDSTRIAAASPALWRDIVLANRDAIAPLLNLSQQRLDELRAALTAGDGAAIEAWLHAGSVGRTRYEQAQNRR